MGSVEMEDCDACFPLS